METDGKPQCILLGVEPGEKGRWESVKAVNARGTNLQLLMNLVAIFSQSYYKQSREHYCP